MSQCGSGYLLIQQPIKHFDSGLCIFTLEIVVHLQQLNHKLQNYFKKYLLLIFFNGFTILIITISFSQTWVV
jgi:hypothetical protein